MGALTGRALLAALLVATSHFLEELLAQPLLHAAPHAPAPLAPLAAVAVVTPCVTLPILPSFLNAHGLKPFAHLVAPSTALPPLLLAAISVLGATLWPQLDLRLLRMEACAQLRLGC